MPFTQTEIIPFLNNSHLFRTLTDENLALLVKQMEIVHLPKGKLLFRQGARPDNFFIILEGKVRVVQHSSKENHRTLAKLVAGDYLGEEELLSKSRRAASAYAESDTVLLKLSYQRFDRLIKMFPALRENLRLAQGSHKNFRAHKLDWLEKDEVVYVMLRKHRFFMWINIIIPVILILVGVFGIIPAVGALSSSVIPLICGGLWYLFALGFLAWQIIDWANDYNIVTNKRVVKLEKIALLYDSRVEAPLGTLLSVAVESSWLGRIVGYGNVIVRTFTGTIVMRRVGFPAAVASMVEEYWSRAKETNREVESSKMREAIKRRLGLVPVEEIKPPAPLRPARKIAVKQTVKPGWLQRFFAYVFHMRYEAGGVITYRKHWIVLVENTWKPAFFILLGIAVLVFYFASGFLGFIPTGGMIGLMVIYFLGTGLWYLYHYIDWRNDIYVVTHDQIMDIERKPLGKEEKKTAPIENILTIEYERLGIIGLLLNFGTVYITVGVTKFTFDQVYDPSSVQQELFRRLNERVENKKEREAEAERERVSEWIATYHTSLDELRRLENERDAKRENDADSG